MTRRDARMSLAAHVSELRKRAVRSAAAVLAGTVGGWFVSPLLLAALRAPIAEAAASQHRLAALNFDTITGAFDLRMQAAFAIGLVASSPIWLYQAWAYLVPALSRKELRYGFGFFFTAVPLFLGGCVAGWLIVPHIVLLLTGFAGDGSSSFIQANDYFQFVLKLVVAAGFAFVSPVFLVLLNLLGILPARSILRSWWIAFLVIVGFTAIVTPSADVISMLLLAGPLIALYYAAWSVAALHDRRVARQLV
ncbi:twin-arginine translocase subunit TatC [Leifsonia shinshuensis]|uniref:Sec-independent protein translocase protein TatC n=1 Tax=Leifsonia shinshuensis TaxID=150026 RepID=A0A853D3Z8_9MICO|nr:sec-independent protein translocase protein TatC [Leifsonia shinshuensis]